MNAQDLLANQVTYLTYLLSRQPARIEAENLRPTYVSLQQVRESDLSEPALGHIRRVRPMLEEWLRLRRPVRLYAAQAVLAALRQALAVMNGASSPRSGLA